MRKAMNSLTEDEHLASKDTGQCLGLGGVHLPLEWVFSFTGIRTRSQEITKDWLDHSIDTLMVDGYQGYDSACTDYPIQRRAC